MNQEEKMLYYELFEEMVSAMTDIPGFNRDRIVNVVTRICELFRLSKAETMFYRTLSHEKRGDGESICDYDNGRSAKIAVQRRLVVRSGAVVQSTVYQSAENTLTEEEAVKVDIMLRAMMSFIGRNRLTNAVEMLGFYDEFGYPNIRAFTRHVERISSLNKIGEYTAVCFNLQRFSIINIQLGREQGDIAMMKYFNLIKNIIGDDGVACRLGGDNFVACFRDEVKDQILEVFGGVPVAYDMNTGKRVMVSACAGVFDIPDGFSPENPMAMMDKIYPAMMIAKQEDHGVIVTYDDSMEKMRANINHIRDIFPKALEDDEFQPYYQPKVDVTWGTIVGAEALCRWVRDGKIVPPMEFIPVLEQNTDICRLDYYMLERVCKDLRRWIDEGKKVVRVSTNFSRKNLAEVDLLSDIISVVDKYKIPHDLIEIELTETTTVAGFRDLKRVVTGLREVGISTSIDDFGMGYSSLNLLQDVPWNVLKIDKSFLPMDDEKNMSKNHLMYKHVVSMAREIGLEVITEGVETSKQLDILRNNHCHVAQGYYFDKPLPVEEFEDRLDKHKYDLSNET